MILRRDMARRLLLTLCLLLVGLALALQTRSDLAWSAEQTREDARNAKLAGAATRPGERSTGGAAALERPAAVLARYPLSDLPLLRAGLEAALAGNVVSARPLVREAARRNPRSINARTWLAADAIRRRDGRGALRQLDRLMALRPTQSASFYPLLGTFARDPVLQDELGHMVKAASWGPAFLSYLTATSGDSGLVFHLTNATIAAQKDNGWVANQQAQLIQSLLDRGDYERAYLSWVNFLPQSVLGETGLIYDAGFKGLPGPAPFNWRLIQSSDATVTLESGSGLTIDYHGENAASFAEQVVMLDPRSYRLSFAGTGDPPGDAGKQLLLHIYCLPGRTVVGELPIDPTHPGAIAFTVPPASCPAQLIAFEGSPGEFPAQRQVSLRQLQLIASGEVP